MNVSESKELKGYVEIDGRVPAWENPTQGWKLENRVTTHLLGGCYGIDKVVKTVPHPQQPRKWTLKVMTHKEVLYFGLR